MSFLRTSVLATMIVGAGLGSLAGVASAHESGQAAKGCSNGIAASSENGAGRTLGDTTGGDQDLGASNTCDILNGNIIGSGNNAAAGDIVNGDTTTRNSESTETNTITDTVTGLLPV